MLVSSKPFVVALVMIGVSAPAATAVTHNISTSTGLFTPSFRGGADTTWVGWDTFDDGNPDPLNELILDVTPDIGTDGGSFSTNNAEDHRSSSTNYYSGSGSVDETITFDVARGPADGFTTIIVQAKTAFGPFGEPVAFGDIDGNSPVEYVAGPNAVGGPGQSQLLVKYEIEGLVSVNSFIISSGSFSFTSYDQFVIDTQWSETGYAPDTAIVPEPASLALLGLGGMALLRRRSAVNA